MAVLITKVIVYLNENGVDYKTKRPDWSVDEFCITDDGEGEFIENWNADTIGLPKPTDEQLNALDSKANTHQENARTMGKRRTAYGNIGEQLDMQYWDKVNGTTLWQEMIAKVKTDNPKS